MDSTPTTLRAAAAAARAAQRQQEAAAATGVAAAQARDDAAAVRAAATTLATFLAAYPACLAPIATLVAAARPHPLAGAAGALIRWDGLLFGYVPSERQYPVHLLTYCGLCRHYALVEVALVQGDLATLGAALEAAPLARPACRCRAAQPGRCAHGLVYGEGCSDCEDQIAEVLADEARAA